MMPRAARRQPGMGAAWWRSWSLVGAVLVALVALLPPVGVVARHAAYGVTLQFALLAIALPALAVAGAPWRALGLSRRDGGACPKLGDRLADVRRRQRQLPRALAFVGADVVAAVVWHTPVAVGAVAIHAWLASLEAVSLLVFGIGAWLELIESPPFTPRSGLLRRAVLATLCMWAFWILAYVTGLSNHGFYDSFRHGPGGLSRAADEQIAAALLWLVAALAFVPVIFWNALRWLQSEEDPDSELLALARAEHRRGSAPHPKPPRARPAS